MIRKYKTEGGILLTASHNPGGPDADFGIKFNISNGGPAPDMVTNKIHQLTTSIREYQTVPTLMCDVSKVGIQKFDVRHLVDILMNSKDRNNQIEIGGRALVRGGSS